MSELDEVMSEPIGDRVVMVTGGNRIGAKLARKLIEHGYAARYSTGTNAAVPYPESNRRAEIRRWNAAVDQRKAAKRALKGGE